MVKFAFQDLGIIDYKQAWDHQESIFTKLVEAKTSNTAIDTDNCIIFCEHPHVYTLGKSGQQNNLLINDDFLKKINASYYKIDRGGDITYHGPGQIVGYPIIDLEKVKLSVKDYIAKLEQSIIDTLLEYNIVSERLDGATGVWIDTANKQKTRKICAIGVKASRYVTMHGFALNVNTDLSYFNHINPCGFVDKGVTSMQKELGNVQDFNLVKEKLAKNIEKVFNITLIKQSKTTLA